MLMCGVMTATATEPTTVTIMAIVKSSLLLGGTTAFSIIQSYTLYDSQRNILGCCNEVTRPPSTITIAPDPDDEEEEEDEVEMFYPTTNRYFMFPPTDTNTLENNNNDDDDTLLRIRQTSFGCGRLGSTVWPSAIALSSLLAGPTYRSTIQTKRILELGSGCGLPSLTAKTICNCVDVLPTDYWERDGLVIGNRLVPKDLFGVNLQYNVGGCDPYNLDWHDELSVFEVSTNFRPDLIIGSDLVYYPDDTEPLLQTLDIFLKNGLASSGSGSERSVLLILPLPPTAEREALPGFKKRLEGEGGDVVLGNGDRDVVMDELEMVVRSASNGEKEVHNLLRIRI
jgi:hypothetical protein